MIVFEGFKLLPNGTAAENVAYALRVRGGGQSSIRRKVPEVLNLVGLAHKMSSLPDELSGGEQQRVSIARAFVNHPPLLICDEPTGNLDPDTSVGIMQLLYRINRTGTTVFVGEAIRSIGANISTTVAATMTVLIGMFLLGLFIALGSWVLSWTNRVEEGVVVKVFFTQDATDQQINAVRLKLSGMDDIVPANGWTFVSKEEALERMKKR